MFASSGQRSPAGRNDGEEAREFTGNGVASPASVLRLGPAARESFLSDHADAMDVLRIDVADASVEAAVEAVGRRLTQVNQEVLPLEVPTAAKVFRVGGHLFAETAPMVTLADEAPAEMPDFSHAMTRPVGIGNLQVVRQELIGYEAADISHIENVMPGELMRRVTRREETSELILTEERETTQSEERDLQTTQRNELATETQKEGSRAVWRRDQTRRPTTGGSSRTARPTTPDSVTDPAVNKLTQKVRQQRVQREKKVFLERAVHELNNSTGGDPIRGIYQWVDKRTAAHRQHGKRLLYDVVVPEPAAFLIDALKTAAQPENFQLTKPLDPNLITRVSSMRATTCLGRAVRRDRAGLTAARGLRRDGRHTQNRVDSRQAHQGVRRRRSRSSMSDGIQAHVSRGLQGDQRLCAARQRRLPRPGPGQSMEVYIGERTYCSLRSRAHVPQQVLHDERRTGRCR